MANTIYMITFVFFCQSVGFFAGESVYWFYLMWWSHWENNNSWAFDTSQHVTFRRLTVVFTSSFIWPELFRRGEASRCRWLPHWARLCSPQPRHFHHQLTFLLSLIILNWEAFKMSLILIMLRHNMTVTVVWDSGSQISKTDES